MTTHTPLIWVWQHQCWKLGINDGHTSNNERVSLSQELNIRFHKSRKNFSLPSLRLLCLFTWFYPFNITNYICGQSFESINLFPLKRICMLDKMALRSVNIGPEIRCCLLCAIDSLCLECAYCNQTPRKLFMRIYHFLFEHTAVRQGAKMGREERDSQTVDSLISPTQSIKINTEVRNEVWHEKTVQDIAQIVITLSPMLVCAMMNDGRPSAQ